MQSNIKFGFRIHQSGYTFEELKKAVILADTLGYHSVTLYDLLGIPTLECWTTLSALAGITNKIRPVQIPHPPLIIGGHGERHLLRAVAKHADICNIGSELNIQEHSAKLELLEQHCKDVDRDFSEIEVTHNTRVVIAETRSAFEQKVAILAETSHMDIDSYKSEISKSIHGTPEQCIRQIKSYSDYGIGYFFLIFPDPIITDDLVLFAKQVMPAFR